MQQQEETAQKKKKKRGSEVICEPPVRTSRARTCPHAHAVRKVGSMARCKQAPSEPDRRTPPDTLLSLFISSLSLVSTWCIAGFSGWRGLSGREHGGVAGWHWPRWCHRGETPQTTTQSRSWMWLAPCHCILNPPWRGEDLLGTLIFPHSPKICVICVFCIFFIL